MQLYFVMASLTRVYGTARRWYTKTNKRPPLGGMFDALNKRCKLGDLTNYISNASNLQNVICSIPAYGSVLGKRQDKAVRQVLSTKTSKRKRERRTSLCIVHKCAVPKLSSSSKLIAYISHISVNPTAVRTVWVTMFFSEIYGQSSHDIIYFINFI